MKSFLRIDVYLFNKLTSHFRPEMTAIVYEVYLLTLLTYTLAFQMCPKLFKKNSPL